MKKLVDRISEEGQTIIDPFMGSGTTGVACKELKRNFIGIEISPEYFKIAERRINNTTENLL
jgi:site-specific DNA-methyltransferase (adenine-specific)